MRGGEALWRSLGGLNATESVGSEDRDLSDDEDLGDENLGDDEDLENQKAKV